MEKTEVYYVVGLQKGSFTDRRTGRVINYAKIHALLYGYQKDGLIGTAVEAVSIPFDLADKIDLGNYYMLVYNRYGRVTDVHLVDYKPNSNDEDIQN